MEKRGGENFIKCSCIRKVHIFICNVSRIETSKVLDVPGVRDGHSIFGAESV